MKLYIRTQEPGDRRDHVQYDHCFEVDSQAQWRARIEGFAGEILTSVLRPTGTRFALAGPHLHKRSHAHERHYRYDPAIHESYRSAAEKLARSVAAAIAGSRRCLVYLPLRGALPIWRAVRRYLHDIPAERLVEYHAVTSSFVLYPDALEIRGKGGGRASGRYANILELRRLRDWCLGPMGFDHILYVDEIVSGGMMRGHVNEMIELGVTALLPVTVAALADAFGARSKANGYLGRLAAERTIHAFVWEGCHTLISEDQKFMCGTHYVDHDLGPHVVPVLTDTLEWFDEKLRFDCDVVGAVEAFASAPG